MGMPSMTTMTIDNCRFNKKSLIPMIVLQKIYNLKD